MNSFTNFATNSSNEHITKDACNNPSLAKVLYNFKAVSYTHLDVYKRQRQHRI